MKEKLVCGGCGNDDFNRIHELHMNPDGTDDDRPEGPIGKLISFSCRHCGRVYTLDDFIGVYDTMDEEQGLFLKTPDGG